MKKVLLIIACGAIGLFAALSLLLEESNSENVVVDAPSSKKSWIADKGATPTGYMEYMKAITTSPDSKDAVYGASYRYEALEKAKSENVARKATNKRTETKYVATSRGPGNVSGRTRSVIVDPDDATNNTWFAGTSGGGIWKTTDAGSTWVNLTEGMPNMSMGALAMSASNHDVIYAGSGEVFSSNLDLIRGDGIFKSVDRGVTWSHLAATRNPSFISVNGIVVDPANEDIAVACTNTGVYKTIDGGMTWTETHQSNSIVQDIEVEASNYSVQYVAITNEGVFKSTDGGDSWKNSSDGLGDLARIELAVSTKDESVLYACTYDAADNTLVYRSGDSGASWVQFADADGEDANFLGEQGWFDNTIAVNPYNENEVFLGGVYMGKYEFNGELTSSDPAFIGVDQENTASFLTFVSFSASAFGGQLEIGDGDDASDEFFNVEIRFGEGKSQKAHRFNVPADGGANGDGGAGIGAADYTFADYIDVPFEVWDTDNDRQLMVSFRDQQNNGVFNLNERDDANDPELLLAREYVFISNETYSETESATIGVDGGGHLVDNMYFFWPIAPAADTWDAETLPESLMRIKYGSIQIQAGDSEIVADPRGGFGGKNGNVHADHHHLTILGMDDDNETIRIINGNDGGMALSDDNGETWKQILEGFVTTQFYDAAKKPGSDQYFGGMQDNGTWMSPNGEVSSAATNFSEKLGGDGFEVVWHATDPNKMMGSIYNNRIHRSIDGGTTWPQAQSGINTSDTEAPFITRLATSDSNPEVVYAVSALGVYKTEDFGGSWDLTEISATDGWTFLNGDPAEPYPISTLRVDVSNADHNIVWGGSGMDSDQRVFVSTDAGETFNPTVNYFGGTLGSLTGLGTHPSEPNTAFALFGVANGPKILRTKDLGQTWEDLSGFGENAESDNGFPNVIVHSILVLPHEPTTIFAGTEIGMFESNDDGASWHLSDHGLPTSSIWEMEVRDDQVVFATYGRGIWTLTINALLNSQAAVVSGAYSGEQTASLGLKLPVSYSSLEVYLDDMLVETIASPTSALTLNSETGFYDYALTVTASDMLSRSVHIVTEFDGTKYTSGKMNFDADFAPMAVSLDVNASNDMLIDAKFNVSETYDSFEIYLNDQIVETKTDVQVGEFSTSLEVTASGNYVVKAVGHIGSLSFESSQLSVVVNLVAGIEGSNETFDVYPNPVSDVLSLKALDLTKSSGYKLSVLSINGQVIFSEARIATAINHTLDVSALENGLYVLKIESAGSTKISKFIKK